MSFVDVALNDGYIVKVDEEALDDQELLDALMDMDINPQNYAEVLKRLLTADEKKKLYDHVRGQNGRVKATVIASDLMQILGNLKHGKNS